MKHFPTSFFNISAGLESSLAGLFTHYMLLHSVAFSLLSFSFLYHVCLKVGQHDRLVVD